MQSQQAQQAHPPLLGCRISPSIQFLTSELELENMIHQNLPECSMRAGAVAIMNASNITSITLLLRRADWSASEHERLARYPLRQTTQRTETVVATGPPNLDTFMKSLTSRCATFTTPAIELQSQTFNHLGLEILRIPIATLSDQAQECIRSRTWNDALKNASAVSSSASSTSAKRSPPQELIAALTEVSNSIVAGDMCLTLNGITATTHEPYVEQETRKKFTLEQRATSATAADPAPKVTGPANQSSLEATGVPQDWFKHNCVQDASSAERWMRSLESQLPPHPKDEQPASVVSREFAGSVPRDTPPPRSYKSMKLSAWFNPHHTSDTSTGSNLSTLARIVELVRSRVELVFPGQFVWVLSPEQLEHSLTQSCELASMLFHGFPTPFRVTSAGPFSAALDRDPVTRRELRMVQAMGVVRDKPQWWKKVQSATLCKKWSGELRQLDEEMKKKGRKPLLTERNLLYMWHELRWWAQQYESDMSAHHLAVQPAAVDGVFLCDGDGFMSADTHNRLLEAVKAVEDARAVAGVEPDVHPGSDGQVINLVHPSMNCLRIGQGGSHFSREAVTRESAWLTIGSGYPVQGVNPFYKNETSSRFAWLPTDIQLTPNIHFAGQDGPTPPVTVRFTSYINGLHPSMGAEATLYSPLEDLVARFVPMWDLVLANVTRADLRSGKPAIAEAKAYWLNPRKTPHAYERVFFRSGDGNPDQEKEWLAVEQAEQLKFKGEAGGSECVGAGDSDALPKSTITNAVNADRKTRCSEANLALGATGYMSVWDDYDTHNTFSPPPYVRAPTSSESRDVQLDASTDANMIVADSVSSSSISAATKVTGKRKPNEEAAAKQGENEELEPSNKKQKTTVEADGESSCLSTGIISMRPSELLKLGRLQVIIKISTIVLTPDKPNYPGGAWHIEGMSNERIVASGIYYLENENISESRLAFRHAVHSIGEDDDDEELFDQQSDEFPELYDLEDYEQLNQLLGSVHTRSRRALAWNNCAQHQVQPFSLIDPTKSGHRRIVVAFLVDPVHYVPSTTYVPPQQREWLSQSIHLVNTALLESTSMSQDVIDICLDYLLPRDDFNAESKIVETKKTQFGKWQQEVNAFQANLTRLRDRKAQLDKHLAQLQAAIRETVNESSHCETQMKHRQLAQESLELSQANQHAALSEIVTNPLPNGPSVSSSGASPMDVSCDIPPIAPIVLPVEMPAAVTVTPTLTLVSPQPHTVSHSLACVHRLELMKERKFFIQSESKLFEAQLQRERPVSMCEH